MKIGRGLQSLISTGILALGLGGLNSVDASVVIAGTRAIYQAKDRETTVKMSNEGKTPALVQAWLDDGDPKAAPSEVSVPFTITPPLSRIDPAKAQTLRIMHTGEPLPTDKESVFWLNVLEIPPKPEVESTDANMLQIAFRTRIKMFYRPMGLAGEAVEAPSKVVWRIVLDGKNAVLEARNPTPYFVSYGSVELISGETVLANNDGGMIAPGETQGFPLSKNVAAPSGSKVRYQAINDWGGPIDGDSPLGKPD